MAIDKISTRATQATYLASITALRARLRMYVCKARYIVSKKFPIVRYISIARIRRISTHHGNGHSVGNKHEKSVVLWRERIRDRESHQDCSAFY